LRSPKSGIRKETLTGKSVQVVAIYDYEANSEDELSFFVGDKIKILEMNDEKGWWRGAKEDGTEGTFPSNYVTFVEDDKLGPASPRSPDGSAPAVSPRPTASRVSFKTDLPDIDK